MFWISLLLFCFAAVFNAAVEQIAHHNGGRFRIWFANHPNLARWFNAEGDSWRIENEQIYLFRWWRLLPIIPAFLSDAWHFLKMMSVVCLILAIAFYRPQFSLFVDIFMLYLVRVGTMQFFYNYFFSPVRPFNMATWFKNIF